MSCEHRVGTGMRAELVCAMCCRAEALREAIAALEEHASRGEALLPELSAARFEETAAVVRDEVDTIRGCVDRVRKLLSAHAQPARLESEDLVISGGDNPAEVCDNE